MGSKQIIAKMIEIIETKFEVETNIASLLDIEHESVT